MVRVTCRSIDFNLVMVNKCKHLYILLSQVLWLGKIAKKNDLSTDMKKDP